MNDKSIIGCRGGVIWITGFSASGKTTIGRKVAALLRKQSCPALFLDGDDLRSILGRNWDYEREQRIELARIYFRLCSHLQSQGLTVVISAVAMYQEVFDWVRLNIPNSIQVYLDVPELERRRRDFKTKRIYNDSTNFLSMYDEPSVSDLVIHNFGGRDPDQEADRIVNFFNQKEICDWDMGRGQHWSHYYSKAALPVDPSAFARKVAALYTYPINLLEIGCGNGRDASFFSLRGHTVTAIDFSTAAIEKCSELHGHLERVQFLTGKLSDLSEYQSGRFDVVYTRFVLHAMPLEEEVETLRSAFFALRPGGDLHIECRSINDPLARLGDVISPTERIYGHYRRFIIKDEIYERLNLIGFEILYAEESNGLAVFGNEDPVVIRILARKPC